MLISAVVCTRDRADMAVRAIKSLIDQSADPAEYEILVIDNGSTDDTEEKVRTLADKTARVQVRYVKEPRTGIAHARNTGYEEAQGEYVAFIDDDAAAEPAWITRLIETIRAQHEPPVAVGGRILPLYEAPKPHWFLERYEERTWGETARALQRNESFSASNMTILREALVEVGGFPTDVGMTGDRLLVGEEPQLFERLWDKLECEGRIVYDPRLRVRHSVTAGKMKLFTEFKRTFVAGQFHGIVIKRSGGVRFVPALRAFAVLCTRLVLALFKVGHPKRWVYEGTGIIGEPLGRFLTLIGIEPKLKRN
ncbi:MAG: glycosyltransferase family 2 protein [Armatimonadetes bacterium]|nr:glycosyltransferase family 2 protein [Armatimonadota bacterium]